MRSARPGRCRATRQFRHCRLVKFNAHIRQSTLVTLHRTIRSISKIHNVRMTNSQDGGPCQQNDDRAHQKAPARNSAGAAGEVFPGHGLRREAEADEVERGFGGETSVRLAFAQVTPQPVSLASAAWRGLGADQPALGSATSRDRTNQSRHRLRRAGRQMAKSRESQRA